MECLITGIKGFGKTAHALDLVFLQDSEFKGMDVYVEGIAFTEAGHQRCPHFDFPFLSDLKKPGYVPLCTVDAEDEEAEKYKPWLPGHFEHQDFLEARAAAKHPLELWFLWAQKNSVIFLDEAQRFYRPRPSGAKVPLHIRMIEYARHFGIHFVFISQAPRFMDINLRAHIEKHIHLDKTWKGGLKFESVGCMDIDSKIDRKEAAKSPYSPPKHIFPLYVSSSLHLKVKHKIPFAVKVFAFAIPVFIFLVYFIVQKIKHDHELKTPAPNSSVLSVSGVPGVGTLDTASGVLAPSSIAEGKIKKYLADFEPVIPGRPESAPVYEQLRKVASMPRVSACIQGASACVCYTQQGSRLLEVSDIRCRQVISSGFGFDPYQPAPEKQLASVKEKPLALSNPPLNDSVSSDNAWHMSGHAVPMESAPHLFVSPPRTY